MLPALPDPVEASAGKFRSAHHHETVAVVCDRRLRVGEFLEVTLLRS